MLERCVHIIRSRLGVFHDKSFCVTQNLDFSPKQFSFKLSSLANLSFILKLIKFNKTVDFYDFLSGIRDFRKFVLHLVSEKFNSVCIIALEHSEPAQALEEGIKSQIQTVKRIWASSEEDVQHPCGQKFNNFVFFHTNHIDMESSLLNFATLFDLENQVSIFFFSNCSMMNL